MAVRLAELLAGLSRLADLGFGLPSGEALRSGALAVALGRSAGLADDEVRACLYTALLQHVGCTGYAHETARLLGDELALNRAASRTDHADPRDMIRTFLPTLTAGRPPLERLRTSTIALVRGERFGHAFSTAACETGRDAARRLGLPRTVQRSLYHVYELWQGGGAPTGLAGDAIPIASRVARVAGVGSLLATLRGPAAAIEAVRHRGGGMLDPMLADRFVREAPELLATIDEDPRTFVLGAEPPPSVQVADGQLEGVARVFADLADLKSPFLHGHSREVGAALRAAAAHLDLPAAAADELVLAGLLHDLGRVAVSTTIWEKRGRLTADEWEQVRLHTYHGERVLSGSRRLAAVAALVGRHHERLDGSGYHRACSSSELSSSSRLLAVADAHQAMLRPRPHRAALTPVQAETALLEECRRGRLDPDALEAVLAGAGRVVEVPRPDPPAGLTGREVEVLRLLAAGGSNRQIADRLVISPRTAEHHVQHVYAKLGVSSRAAAALFALEHGLLGRGR